jgi:hypothetical protein
VSDTNSLPPGDPEPGPKTKQSKRNERAKHTRSLSKGENRAARLKEARPELASQIGKSISIPEAVKIGGYENGNDMHDKVMVILNAKQAKGGGAPKKKRKPKTKAA